MTVGCEEWEKDIGHPVVVRNLCVILKNEPDPTPLPFVATWAQLGASEGRAYR